LKNEIKEYLLSISVTAFYLKTTKTM